MTDHIGLPDPLDVVARALGHDRSLLSEESEMYRVHGWDSFGHIGVIAAVEAAYHIHIPDDQIDQYTSIRAIRAKYVALCNSRACD